MDYWGGPVIEVPDGERHLRAARQTSLALLYWLQTEAPRPDGGTPLVEWNAGEVAGHLVAFCSQRTATPRQVRASDRLREDFARELDRAGIERHWPTIAGC